MTEEKKIESIKSNGGKSLRMYKSEDITYAMCIAAVSDEGSAIYYVPVEYRTKEIYSLACKSDGKLLEIVPQEYFTQSLCREAVQSYGTSLQYVPDEYVTEDLCLDAVCNDNHALQFVPERILTPSFCSKLIRIKGGECLSALPNSCRKAAFYAAIINEEPEVFYVVPKKYRSATICKKAIKGLGYSSSASAVKEEPQILALLHPSLYDHDTCLEFVKSSFFKERVKWDNYLYGFPWINEFKIDVYGDVIELSNLLRFYDVCLEAVQAHDLIMKAVPQELITQELCDKAVKSHISAFKFVPDQFKTEELCALAFSEDPYNIELIPDDCKTPDMCLTAVKASGGLLGSVPDELKTHEMCAIAVANECRGIYYVPERLFDREIANLAIEHPSQSGSPTLCNIPVNLRDHDICLAAVKKSGKELRYVPDNVKTYDLCLVAAKQSSSIAEFIPKECYTPELCLALTQNGGIAFDFEKIPKDCLTTEACLEAVKHKNLQGQTVIGKVPKGLITQEMCDIAIRTSVSSIMTIPEEFVTEDILMQVAEKAPGLLKNRIPARLKTGEFIYKLVMQYPDSRSYI